MVLPKSMHQRLLPSEVQFLSENELITILPRYSMKRLDLIGVRYNFSDVRTDVQEILSCLVSSELVFPWLLHITNSPVKSCTIESHEENGSSLMGGINFEGTR